MREVAVAMVVDVVEGDSFALMTTLVIMMGTVTTMKKRKRKIEVKMKVMSTGMMTAAITRTGRPSGSRMMAG